LVVVAVGASGAGLSVEQPRHKETASKLVRASFMLNEPTAARGCRGCLGVISLDLRQGRSILDSMAIKTVLVLSLCAASTALAESPPDAPVATAGVHATVELGVATTFLARGVPQFANKNDFATQNAALIKVDNVGPGALTVGVFHEAALNNPERTTMIGGISPQFDPIASYGFPIGRVQASAGYFLHYWPAWSAEQHRDGMHEIQMTAAMDGLVVRPAIEVDLEFVRLHGFYANASLSKAWTTSTSLGDVTISPSIVVGVHRYAKPFQGNFDMPLALREVTGGVGVTWKFGPPFYATLRGSYSYTGIKNWWMEDGLAGRSTPQAIISLGVAN
jgi:hypothetical protein